MARKDGPLNGDSSIETWLADPVGGAVLRDMLAQNGQSADAFRPVKKFAIKRLIKLSQGAFTQEMLDGLIAKVAEGAASTDTPADAANTETSNADDEAAPEVELRTWTERIDQGRFAGKSVIVTGAGSGIGRATASRIVREGGRVIAVDVSKERLDEFVAEHDGAQIVALAADITDDAGVAQIVDAAGPVIDGLANVAGIMDDMTPVGDLSDAVWNRVMAVNVTGTMKMMRAVIPAMLAQGGGSIVNIASEAALRGSAAGAAYTASKHAVAGLTKSTAFMYATSGIRVNAVAPGPTITNIQASFASPLGADRIQVGLSICPDPVEADALAASITFLLSDDGVNVTGVILPSDGGWSAT